MRFAAAVLLVMTLSACSGGDSALSKVQRPPVASTAAASTTTTAAAPDYCTSARSFAQAFERFGQAGTAADKRAYYQGATAALQQAVANGPAEIKADLELLAGVLQQLVAGLDAIDYDSTRIRSLPPALVARMMAQEVNDALTRVTRYNRDHCGIS